jgi:FG-GAP-like repeat
LWAGRRPPLRSDYVFGRVDLATGGAPEGLAVGIFKNGGLPGVAVANEGSNTMTILLANSDGTYRPGVDYATGFQPVAVAVVDFNGDKIPDLAVSSNTGGSVSILLGNGHGTFQQLWLALHVQPPADQYADQRDTEYYAGVEHL